VKRVISALIGAPLVVGVLFLAGPGTFLAIVLVLYLMALWEYLRLCGIGGVLLAAALAAGGTALVTAVSPAAGRRSVKTVPRPIVDETAMSPPCFCTIEWTVARPRPCPSSLVE